jgi:protein-S-isoprenylcysteine O-methyltransferase Ste14
VADAQYFIYSSDSRQRPRKVSAMVNASRPAARAVGRIAMVSGLIFFSGPVEARGRIVVSCGQKLVWTGCYCRLRRDFWYLCILLQSFSDNLNLHIPCLDLLSCFYNMQYIFSPCVPLDLPAECCKKYWSIIFLNNRLGACPIYIY